MLLVTAQFIFFQFILFFCLSVSFFDPQFSRFLSPLHHFCFFYAWVDGDCSSLFSPLYCDKITPKTKHFAAKTNYLNSQMSPPTSRHFCHPQYLKMENTVTSLILKFDYLTLLYFSVQWGKLWLKCFFSWYCEFILFGFFLKNIFEYNDRNRDTQVKKTNGKKEICLAPCQKAKQKHAGNKKREWKWFG